MRRMRRIKSAQSFNSFLQQAVQDHKKVIRRAEALRARLFQINSLLQRSVDSSLRRGIQLQERREERLVSRTELQADRLNLKLEWQQSSSQVRQLKQQQDNIKQDLSVVSQKQNNFREKILLMEAYSLRLQERVQQLSLQVPLKKQEIQSLDDALFQGQRRIKEVKSLKGELVERYEQAKIKVRQITQKKRHVTKQTHFSVQQRQNFYRLTSNSLTRLAQLTAQAACFRN